MPHVTYNLGVALALGLIVGLQRQRTDARVAGFRTFPLVTLLGTVCATVAEKCGGAVVAAGAVALGGGVAVLLHLKPHMHSESGLATSAARLAGQSRV